MGSGNDVTVGVRSTFDSSGTSAAISQLNQLSQTLNAQTTAMNYLRQASAQMGSQMAQNQMAWVRAAQSSEEYAARLRVVQAQLNNTQTSQKNLKAGGDDLATMLENVGGRWLSMATSMFSAQAAIGLISSAFNEVTSAIQTAIAYGEQFLQQSFMLADSAQRMESLWGYQYGGPQGGGPQIASQLAAWIPNFAMNTPYTMMDVMGAVGPMSQLGLSFQGLQRYLPLISDLAATHTSIFGGGGPLPLPYAALAVMEATKGYSRRLLMELQIRPNELEPYGVKFVGDKESGQLQNPEMFLPALEAYAKDKGFTGAGKEMAHNTIWGLGASLTDRLQSFQRRLMGENIPDPNAGALSQAVLDDIKHGDIRRAMMEVGADQASLKSYGVDFTATGVTDISKFQDALQQFSQDKFYASLKDQPEFKKGTIFDVILQGMKDFSSWWDAHQATFDKVSKFVSDVGGKLLNAGRGDLSSLLSGAASGFSTGFTGGATWGKLGGDFLSWLTDPKNQQAMQAAGEYIGHHLGRFLSELGDDLKKLQAAWDAIPENIKTGVWIAAKDEFKVTIELLHGVVIAIGEILDYGHHLIDDFKQSGFFRWITNEAGNMNKMLADGAKLWALLKLAMEGKISFKDLLDALGQVNQDILTIIKSSNDAANALIGVNSAIKSPFGNASGAHKAGSGPGEYGYVIGGGGFSGSVTQTNSYTIYGASSAAVQSLIDANTQTLANTQNTLVKTPGSLQYNVVGLF